MCAQVSSDQHLTLSSLNLSPLLPPTPPRAPGHLHLEQANGSTWSSPSARAQIPGVCPAQTPFWLPKQAECLEKGEAGTLRSSCNSRKRMGADDRGGLKGQRAKSGFSRNTHRSLFSPFSLGCPRGLREARLGWDGYKPRPQSSPAHCIGMAVPFLLPRKLSQGALPPGLVAARP